MMPCPECRAEVAGPYSDRSYSDRSYRACSGAAALARLVAGDEPYLGLYTFTPEGFAPCAHMDALAMAGVGFFSVSYLSGLLGPVDGSRIMSVFAALVTAVRHEIAAGEPCPRCNAVTFIRDGQRYHRRPGPALAVAARALYVIRPERAPCPCFYASDYYVSPRENDGHDDAAAPFFSEAYLYNLIGKEDARSVISRIHNLLRAAGAEDPWQYERGTA
jgi:hypothetical protein